MSAVHFLSRPSSRGRVGGPQLVHVHQLHTWVVSFSQAFGTAGFRAVLCPQLSGRARRCLTSEGRLALPTTVAWPTGNMRGPQPLLSPPRGVRGVSWWCRPLSPVLSDAERSSVCFLAMCVSSLEQCSFRSFAHFKNGLSFYY